MDDDGKHVAERPSCRSGKTLPFLARSSYMEGLNVALPSTAEHGTRNQTGYCRQPMIKDLNCKWIFLGIAPLAQHRQSRILPTVIEDV
jgi:hypothetical protein